MGTQDLKFHVLGSVVGRDCSTFGKLVIRGCQPYTDALNETKVGHDAREERVFKPQWGILNAFPSFEQTRDESGAPSGAKAPSTLLIIVLAAIPVIGVGVLGYLLGCRNRP